MLAFGYAKEKPKSALSEKVNLLDLIRKGKKWYGEVAKICGKNASSILEIVKKEKEMCARFVVASQTAIIMATVLNKSLAKMEKALNLWVEDISRERPHVWDFYCSTRGSMHEIRTR